MPEQKLPNPKKTKKKFYNKFVYKISLSIPGIGGLRYFDSEEFLRICQNSGRTPDRNDWRNRIVDKMIDNRDIWLSLIPFINQFDSKSFTKRLEGDTIDFYTNDKKFYDGLSNNFGRYVRLRFQPPKGQEQAMLDADKVIFAKKLPHDLYQYKAFLCPHKIPAAEKQTLIQWLDKQKPSITLTESIKKWILHTTENWDRRYIYIQNDQTLLMLKLRCPELVGQIFKYEIIR
jgi:hypothetical protein